MTTEAPPEPTQEMVSGGTVQTESVTIAPWIYSNSNTAPPNATQVRGNQNTWVACTTLWFSNTDANSTNRVDRLSTLKAGDKIRLEHNTDNTIWETYTVSAPAVANTGYFTVTVASSGSSGKMPQNNQTVTVTLSVMVTVTVAIGHMAIDLVLQPNITEAMGTDLMDLFCDFLQTVTHLVNHAELAGNINGVIISDSEDILPAMVGNPITPPPTP